MERSILLHNMKGIAMRYAEFTGDSVKIETSVWKHRDDIKCSVDWSLSTVGGFDSNLHCERKEFKTISELHDFVVGRIEAKEILFRKFS